MTIVMLAAACGTDNSEDLAAEAAEAKQMITVLEDIRDELATAKEERDEVATAKDALAESNSDLERKLAQLEESLEEKEALIELLMERSDNAFEELVALIEEGEALMETEGKDLWEPKEEAAALWCGGTDWSSSKCFAAIDALDKVYEDVHANWIEKMPGLQARLASLNLSSEHPDASRARDSFIEHMRAWRNYQAEESFLFPSLVDFRLDQSVLMEWIEMDRAGYSATINGTFADTCTGLGNSQPKDDSYRERIIDICDD